MGVHKQNAESEKSAIREQDIKGLARREYPQKEKIRLATEFFVDSNGHLQFLQPFASDALLDAFACLPDCALLSLSAEDCLPFALDLVFSMLTPFRGCAPYFGTFVLCG